MPASTMNLLLLALMLMIIATFQVGVDALPINVYQGNFLGLVPINANAANTCSNSDYADWY